MQENRDVRKYLALHYYVSASPFQRVEEQHLRKAFQICRADVQLPSRKDLAGPLLDVVYEEIKLETDKILSDKTKEFTVTTDAWSNVCNQSVIDFVAVNPQCTLFVSAVFPNQKRHTTENLVEWLDNVIKTIPANTSGATTDNTAANKAMWRTLQKKYPTKFFQGCVCHCLNLLVKDIFRSSSDEVKGPFDDLVGFAEDCREIVKYFRNHQVEKYELENRQAAQKVKRLVTPATTRWGTILGCFETLLSSENILHAYVMERSYLSDSSDAKQKMKREAIRNTISKPTFVSQLKRCIEILKPMCSLITYFQADDIPVSDVFYAFIELPKQYQSLPLNEKTFIEERIQERWRFISGDAHEVGYLLDPRYLGEGMGESQKQEVENMVTSFPPDDVTETTDQRRITLFQELSDFQVYAESEKKNKTLQYKMLPPRFDFDVKKHLELRKQPHVTVLSFWQRKEKRWPLLQSLAIRVFQVVVSSSACERSFSNFGFIHTELRNKLDKERVKKLVFIRANWNGGQRRNAEDEDDEDVIVELGEN